MQRVEVLLRREHAVDYAPHEWVLEGAGTERECVGGGVAEGEAQEAEDPDVAEYVCCCCGGVSDHE